MAFNSRRAKEPLDAVEKNCNELAHTKPEDLQTIAAKNLEMSINYYRAVYQQAQQSFITALVIAAVSIFFFLIAIFFMMEQNNIANLSLIAGALTQVISAINFYLYFQASRQFALFHQCLERTNRFIFANSLCERVKNEQKKDEIREELMKIIANAPTFTSKE